LAFRAIDLVIPMGTTVTWMNMDLAVHTVTWDDKSAAVRALP
jgi:plastocyanin